MFSYRIESNEHFHCFQPKFHDSKWLYIICIIIFHSFYWAIPHVDVRLIIYFFMIKSYYRYNLFYSQIDLKQKKQQRKNSLLPSKHKYSIQFDPITLGQFFSKLDALDCAAICRSASEHVDCKFWQYL